MRLRFKYIGLIFAGLLTAGCSQADKNIPKIEVKEFFKNPEKIYFKLSPSGKFISYLKPHSGKFNLYITAAESDSAVRITNVTKHDVDYYRWIDDDRLVYAKDIKGDDNYHLFLVSRSGKVEKDITPYENTRAIFARKYDAEPNTIIVAMNLRDKSLFDIYKLNIETGKKKLLEKNPGNVSSWIIDKSGNVRLAIQSNGVNQTVLYKKKKSNEFISLLTTDFREEFVPLRFSADEKYIYAISNIGRDKSAFVKYDPESNREVEVIFSHPEVDVTKVIFSEKDDTPIAARYVTWKRHYKFFKPEWNEVDKLIRRELPQYDYKILSRSEDEKLTLIRTYSDKTIGSYYLVNIKNLSLKKIANISPWLNEEFMARQEPIRFEARDGVLLNGYLTLPKNKEPKNLPVVINVHGGPWYRSQWGFDHIHQFFANRGYAVLDVNYRGSSGYGKKFFEAGFKEWGGKIQDDITDGTNWLIEQGIADKNRIAIFGYSFGGYSALMGAALRPGLYACAVDYSGLVDLQKLYSAIPVYYKPFLEMMYEMIGDPVKDAELLKSFSPIYLTDKFVKPVFVAQGALDTKVKKEDVDKFVEALRKNNVDVEYLVMKNERHSFDDEKDRIELFNKIEKFINTHTAPKGL